VQASWRGKGEIRKESEIKGTIKTKANAQYKKTRSRKGRKREGRGEYLVIVEKKVEGLWVPFKRVGNKKTQRRLKEDKKGIIRDKE